MRDDLLPLAIDLDGTLIKTDILWESLNAFIIRYPYKIFQLIFWMLRGKAYLKYKLSKIKLIDISVLPYDLNVINWIRQQKSRGRQILLITATNQQIADEISSHLNLFDKVYGSSQNLNLKGCNKRDFLLEMYGVKGFDYLGNDQSDIPIWIAANISHVVSSSDNLINKIKSLARLGITFDGRYYRAAFLRAIRPYQWVKNILIFLPLIAAHQFSNVDMMLNALIAFLLFSMIASGVYLLNDLADIDSDRHHSRKSGRPFASGELSILTGWLIWPLIIFVAFLLAIFFLNLSFLITIAIYFGLTLAYTFKLKSVPILDVLVLAMLYSLRVIAGAAVISVVLSFWLLAISVFLFLSLALIKRYTEIYNMPKEDKVNKLRGRGYIKKDLQVVSELGVASSYVSVLVLALYIQDPKTLMLYSTPIFIWFACPLLIFWISRLWLLAHRGEIHDDPILFAIKDSVSWVVVLLTLVVFIIARVY